MEAYVDGELAQNDPPAAEAVRAHLATCDDCRRQHDHAASLPFRLKALRSPQPPGSLVTAVMSTIAPKPQQVRRAWELLVPEAVLVAFILWYLSGVEGLTSLATGAWSDLGALAVWAFGGAPLPSVPAADVLLLGALIALSITAVYHLSVLTRLTDSARRPTTRLGERRRA
jgi:predicted anti-sigma-YlaC factor YlaD